MPSDKVKCNLKEMITKTEATKEELQSRKAVQTLWR